jgi:retron-type reverse transcriptase
VQEFLEDAPRRLGDLSDRLFCERWRPSAMSEFIIYDPKQRLIHAPRFPDRIVHHALILQVGDHLDKMQIDDSFACRVGKGPTKAVERAQHFGRRFPWYLKMDIAGYFHSISHDVLLEFVTRRIADGGVLRLVGRILQSFQASPRTGLPIGALTSQHLANLYLAGFDRWITSHAACRGYVRYMDDMVVWCQTRSEAKALLMCAGEILWDIWKLRLKGQSQINRASAGLPFCGYRIYPGMIRLTRRKKLIYRRIVSHWEERYRLGSATTAQLQAGIASALAAVQAAESVSWRRGELQRSQFGEI